MTCDEPVNEDLDLETLKCRRDFCILKWYHKVMCMNSNSNVGVTLEGPGLCR